MISNPFHERNKKNKYQITQIQEKSLQMARDIHKYIKNFDK